MGIEDIVAHCFRQLKVLLVKVTRHQVYHLEWVFAFLHPTNQNAIGILCAGGVGLKLPVKLCFDVFGRLSLEYLNYLAKAESIGDVVIMEV